MAELIPKALVSSEIGTLRHVLVHRPGAEVDHMPPQQMHQWLFDDILYGPRSRREHDRFCEVLAHEGVIVSDFQSLLKECLEGTWDRRSEILRGVLEVEGEPPLLERCCAMDSEQLAQVLITGFEPSSPPEVSDGVEGLIPIPNLLFCRDPQFMLGDSIYISRMRHEIRSRESRLSHYLFSCHPMLNRTRSGIDFNSIADGMGPAINIEGGDVLVLAEGIVVVGLSQRTTRAAADLLMDQLREGGHFRAVIMVPMPQVRHAMHLDTIFTRIAEDECLVYAPMVLSGGSESLEVISCDIRGSTIDQRTHAGLLEALASHGVSLKPLYCGGSTDLIHQSREQWTDGANAFAIAPGRIMLYERNERTVEELDRHGYEIIPVRHLPADASAWPAFDGGSGGKVAFVLESAELSRARGGPRCMTSPLTRDPLHAL